MSLTAGFAPRYDTAGLCCLVVQAGRKASNVASGVPYGCWERKKVMQASEVPTNNKYLEQSSGGGANRAMLNQVSAKPIDKARLFLGFSVHSRDVPMLLFIRLCSTLPENLIEGTIYRGKTVWIARGVRLTVYECFGYRGPWGLQDPAGPFA